MKLCFGVVFLFVLGVFGSVGASLCVVHAKELPQFFAYLRAVDDTILQVMRYFGEHNFLGCRVPGAG